VSWASETPGLDCMVLFLNAAQKLAFQDCKHVIELELTRPVILKDLIHTVEGVQTVRDVLAHARAEIEVGHRSKPHWEEEKKTSQQNPQKRSKNSHLRHGRKGQPRKDKKRGSD
jgi:hypothetical protein